MRSFSETAKPLKNKQAVLELLENIGTTLRDEELGDVPEYFRINCAAAGLQAGRISSAKTSQRCILNSRTLFDYATKKNIACSFVMQTIYDDDGNDLEVIVSSENAIVDDVLVNKNPNRDAVMATDHAYVIFPVLEPNPHSVVVDLTMSQFENIEGQFVGSSEQLLESVSNSFKNTREYIANSCKGELKLPNFVNKTDEKFLPEEDKDVYEYLNGKDASEKALEKLSVRYVAKMYGVSILPKEKKWLLSRKERILYQRTKLYSNTGLPILQKM